MSAKAELVRTVKEDSLPLGWTLTTIESLVGKGGVFIDGDWVESKDQDPEGDVRLIQLADIGGGAYRDRSARFLTHAKAVELGCTFLNKGDVLIARMPDPLGRACIFPGDSKPAVTVVDVAIVRSAAGEFNHRWLMYFVNAPAFRSAVASMQSGSTRKRISRGNLSKIALPVPPIDEQKRIVAEIEKQYSRLDEAVANLKRVGANLRHYKAAVLKAAVEGRLVETEADLARREGRSYQTGEQLLQRILETRRSQWQGKRKYKEPLPPDTTDLPELPQGWVWVSLDQLTTQIADVDHKMPKAFEGGIPYVSTKDFFGENEINFERAKCISPSDFNVLCKKVRPTRGDILLSRYGTVGEVRTVETDLPFQASYSVAILKPVRGEGHADYLATSMRSEVIQLQIKRDVRATAQPDLGLAHIRQLLVPFPPLAEQRRIVAEVDRCLSLLRETEAQVDANLRRAERLRQSILSRAFSGELLPASHSEHPIEDRDLPLAAAVLARCAAPS